MNRLIDFYFKRPLIFDYLIGLLVVIILKISIDKKPDLLPDYEQLIETISDLANISLTSAGFILTLLTLIITFKSSNKLKIEDASTKNSRFEIFFASKLYFETTKHLKNCIKSLLVISLFGYLFKLMVDEKLKIFLFLYSVLSLTVLLMTLWRCLLILSAILRLQKDN